MVEGAIFFEAKSKECAMCGSGNFEGKRGIARNGADGIVSYSEASIGAITKYSPKFTSHKRLAFLVQVGEHLIIRHQHSFGHPVADLFLQLFVSDHEANEIHC